MSGAKDVVDFVKQPSWERGFWAALAVSPAGKAERVFAGALKGAEQVARAMGIKAAVEASSKGIKKGVKWSEGSAAVRVMKGNPKATEAFKREPYVKITGPKGEVYDKSGNVIGGAKPSATPEAHIPAKDFDPEKFKF